MQKVTHAAWPGGRRLYDAAALPYFINIKASFTYWDLRNSWDFFLVIFLDRIPALTVNNLGRLVDSDDGKAFREQIIVIRQRRKKPWEWDWPFRKVRPLIDASRTVLPGLLRRHLADGK